MPGYQPKAGGISTGAVERTTLGQHPAVFLRKGRSGRSASRVHPEFKRMIQDHVLPQLLGRSPGRPASLFPIVWRSGKFVGCSLDRSRAAVSPSTIRRASHLSVMVRSTPNDAARWDSLREIRQAVEPWLYGEGDARTGPMWSVLCPSAWSVSVAESCTGGRVASLITAIPGSRWSSRKRRHVFQRIEVRLLGVTEEDLIEHGAVSRKVVTSMAEGVLSRSGAHVAVATSGIAGPGGGTTSKPVGTVHIALAIRGGATVHQCLNLRGNRERVQERASWVY